MILPPPAVTRPCRSVDRRHVEVIGPVRHRHGREVWSSCRRRLRRPLRRAGICPSDPYPSRRLSSSRTSARRRGKRIRRRPRKARASRPFPACRAQVPAARSRINPLAMMKPAPCGSATTAKRIMPGTSVGGAMHLAAFAFESACGFVHIVNGDVAHPHRRHAASRRILGDRQQPGNALAVRP